MSKGKLTSLGLATHGSLLVNDGFTVNLTASGYQGVWINSSYTPGSVTTTTVLDKLSRSLPNFLTNCVLTSKLNVSVWRNLLSIGSANSPALGNSRPPSFIPTYAGYGTWENVSVDAYGNVSGSGSQSMVASVYPPKNYGKEQTYSYIYQNKGDYAWITGWPGRNSWQKTSDDFMAAYAPGPSDTGLIDYDYYFSNGFVATVARQAYYEFWYDYQTRRRNQYLEFIKALQISKNFQQTSNKIIATLANSKTFLKGNYSNINDLTTSDIAGVNLATKDFGNDLINLGKALDFENIHVFGLPSKLLLTLQKANALTAALKVALLYSDLTEAELQNILLPTFIPSADQEQRIFNAFKLIINTDLSDICTIINCATQDLDTLADLLNPKKMFPNSYQSLTIPNYSVTTTQSKTYKLIYNGNGVNTEIRNWGQYLTGILPEELALACGAFMMTMNQIKNIRQMQCEKFAQVIANIEITDKDLSLINTSNGTPVNQTITDSSASMLAFGSGNNGVYRYADFFGAMSGQPYNDYYGQLIALINSLPTATLSSIYEQLYTLSLGTYVGDYNTAATILINAANAEIASLTSQYASVIEKINFYWSSIGRQLAIEHRAIALAFKQSSSIYSATDVSDVDSFVRALDQYALETEYCEIAPILDAIANTSSTGGQNLIALLRETRNNQRMMNTGGLLDSDIPDTVPTAQASAVANVVNGSIASVTVTAPGSGYVEGAECECCEPDVTVYPQGGVFGGSGAGAVLKANMDDTGSIMSIDVIDGGSGYDSLNPPAIYIAPPPQPEKQGGPVVAGSFAGSPYTGQDPVPNNLVTSPLASFTVEQAKNLVSGTT